MASLKASLKAIERIMLSVKIEWQKYKFATYKTKVILYNLT